MAMQLGGSGGVKSDINVTPLVDVMLVLLIIMMIVAPLLQQGVAVTLPKATNTTEKPETQEQTVLAIDAQKRLYVNAREVPANDLRRRIEEVLELTEAAYMIDYQMNSLSRGMRQRVGIAKTLLHDPHVIILDEPTSGLDPQARIEVRELIHSLRRFGKTILLSSHILHELSMVCDQIGIIDRGKLLVAGDVQDVMRKFQQHLAILIEVTGEPEKARDLLLKQPNVEKVEITGNTTFGAMPTDLLPRTLLAARVVE